MVEIRNLRPAKGATKNKKRIGRGHGCHVKTSGKGSNGQKARSGGVKAPGFEGGQTPWYRRLPKFKGFKNRFRIEYQEVSIHKLNALEGVSEVSPELLLEKGLVKNLQKPIKLLGNGKLKKKLNIRLHHFTESAKALVEKAGGTVEVI